MLDERHLALKRWERAQQFAGLERESQGLGPSVTCRIRINGSGTPAEMNWDVFLVEQFSAGFACVQTVLEPIPPDLPGPVWLVRGAIDWGAYLRKIGIYYRAGREVPACFNPNRKLGSEILRRIDQLPDSELPGVFSKLREAGLLPTLRAFTRDTCPNSLPWEKMRAYFQDFGS